MKMSLPLACKILSHQSKLRAIFDKRLCVKFLRIETNSVIECLILPNTIDPPGQWISNL